jgi:hypothetical protein
MMIIMERAETTAERPPFPLEVNRPKTSNFPTCNMLNRAIDAIQEQLERDVMARNELR